MQQFASAASLLRGSFFAEDVLKFLWAFERASLRDESWEKVAASRLANKYDFRNIGLSVDLTMRMPSRPMRAKASLRQDTDTSSSETSGHFRSGMLLFEASFVVADFLSRHDDLTQIAEVGTWWEQVARTEAAERANMESSLVLD